MHIIRTLDLKAENTQVRYYWVQYLKFKLIQSRDLNLMVVPLFLLI